MKPTSILILGLSGAAIAAEGQPGVQASEFIYTTAPFPSCHASTIAETPGGMVAAWFGGTEEKHPDVAIYVSRQEDGKWQVPVEVANGNQPDGTRVPCWNPVLFQPPGGPLHLYYKAGPTPQTWWGMQQTSKDNGRTWSAGTRLPGALIGPVKNKPVILPDGAWLASSSTETTARPSVWRVHFERSTDQGSTWTSTGPVHDGVEFSAIQPSILFTGGESLLAEAAPGRAAFFR